jgi:hypothetical protein
MLELALPNSHALAVMMLIIGALILFTRESIPLQTTSLLVLIALTVGFTVFPFEVDGRTLQASDFFLGFGHKALVAVCALMIVGQGLNPDRCAGAGRPSVGQVVAPGSRRVAAPDHPDHDPAQRLHQRHAGRRADDADPYRRGDAHR